METTSLPRPLPEVTTIATEKVREKAWETLDTEKVDNVIATS